MRQERKFNQTPREKEERNQQKEERNLKLDFTWRRKGILHAKPLLIQIDVTR